MPFYAAKDHAAGFPTCRNGKSATGAKTEKFAILPAAERCFAAKLLLEGNTYNQVMAQADISSATLSRVSRCVQYGTGYAKLLK